MVIRSSIFVIALLVLVGCSGADSATETSDDSAAAAPIDAGEAAGGGQAEDGETSGGYGGADEAAQGERDAPAVPAGEPLPDSPPRTGERIIKEGSVTLEVEKGTFDRAFVGVIAAARRFGGDVVGSSTRTGEQGETFGSVTVRVPVASFEDLVVGVGDVGTIRNRDIDSTDVTGEYTDLESRLRHLRAQERFYLGLLERAESVRDAIEVQQQLDGIQGQIEQIQGRLNLLEDRTAFSTLTVELFEPGAGGSVFADDDPAARPTLARYWTTARDAFVNVIGAMLVAGLFALPLLIAFGALFVLWRVVRRPRPQHSAAVADAESDPVPADH